VWGASVEEVVVLDVVVDEWVVEVDLLVVAGGLGLVVGGRAVDEGLEVFRWDVDMLLDVLVLTVLVVLDVLVLNVLVCLVVLVLRAVVLGPGGGLLLLPPPPPPFPPLSSTGVVM
jgi:hypothetical protein